MELICWLSFSFFCIFVVFIFISPIFFSAAFTLFMRGLSHSRAEMSFPLWGWYLGLEASSEIFYLDHVLFCVSWYLLSGVQLLL